MQGAAAERALADYDPFDPELLERPFEYYAALRRHAPVYRDPRTGFFLVSTFAEICEIVRRPDVWSNRFGAALGGARGAPRAEIAEVLAQGWPPVDTMLTADPPEHKRFRGLVNKAFLPRRVNGLEPAMEAIATELIDRFAARGSVELVGEFAVPLPLTVIADQLGVPRADLPRFRAWTDAFVAQLSQMAGAEGELAAAKTIVAFQRYFAAKLDERRAAPRDDILSELVGARLEGERPLDTAESLSILQQLLVAGNETTASAIAEGMWLLARHPDQLAKVRADASLVPNLVEEVLRLSTPTANMFRVALADAEVAGVKIPQGSILFLRYASANRDEKVFAEPERFDVTRANAGDHLAFGLGIHFCLGAMLARKEMQVAFRHLLARLANFRIAAGAEPRHKPSILLRGLAELQLTFDPA
jgi:cytochrome P450